MRFLKLYMLHCYFRVSCLASSPLQIDGMFAVEHEAGEETRGGKRKRFLGTISAREAGSD